MCLSKAELTTNVALSTGLVMLGSMDVGFNTRSVATNKSIIMGDGSSPALKGVGISSATEVDGFQIWSPNSGGSGASAIAVYLEDSTDALVFTENVIGADDANAGTDGSGGNGGDGSDGANGRASALTSCASTRFGGSGGSNTCSGMNVQGGNVAANCPYAYLSGSTIIGNDEPYGSDGSGPTRWFRGLRCL